MASDGIGINKKPGKKLVDMNLGCGYGRERRHSSFTKSRKLGKDYSSLCFDSFQAPTFCSFETGPCNGEASLAISNKRSIGRMRRVQRLGNVATFRGFVTFHDFDALYSYPQHGNQFEKRDCHVIETLLKYEMCVCFCFVPLQISYKQVLTTLEDLKFVCRGPARQAYLAPEVKNNSSYSEKCVARTCKS